MVNLIFSYFVIPNMVMKLSNDSNHSSVTTGSLASLKFWGRCIIGKLKIGLNFAY